MSEGVAIKTFDQSHPTITCHGATFLLDCENSEAIVLDLKPGVYAIPKYLYVKDAASLGGQTVIDFNIHEMQGPSIFSRNGWGYINFKIIVPSYFVNDILYADKYRNVFIASDINMEETIGNDNWMLAELRHKFEDTELIPCSDVWGKTLYNNLGCVLIDNFITPRYQHSFCAVRWAKVEIDVLEHMYEHKGLQETISWALNYGMSPARIRHALSRRFMEVPLIKRSDLYPEPINDINPEWIYATQLIQVFDRVLYGVDEKYGSGVVKHSAEYSAHVDNENYNAKFCSMVENLTGITVADKQEAANTFIDWLGFDPQKIWQSLSKSFFNVLDAAEQYDNGTITEDKFANIQNAEAYDWPEVLDKELLLDALWNDYNTHKMYESKIKLWRTCQAINRANSLGNDKNIERLLGIVNDYSSKLFAGCVIPEVINYNLSIGRPSNIWCTPWNRSSRFILIIHKALWKLAAERYNSIS